MIPNNVTLIVKAPNQQIEDQNIECQSSWTVGQLKGHLSEVYPSKPNTDEQKIIYSGQLLEDNTVLKDVLRTYESQIAHTMHLVCTPKRQKMEPIPKADDETSDGLRLRNVTLPESERERTTEAARPETRQNDQNHSVEMQNYLSSFMNNYGRVPPYPASYFGGAYLPVPNDPAAMANHMMMMQQAYLQYMQQYANAWQADGNVVAGTQPVNVVNETQPQAAPLAEPALEPPPEQVPEEAPLARDWLDWMYAASRTAILFSLVYFYSSPFRFLLVVLLCAMGYLQQIGFFRDLGLNPANNANQARPNDAPRVDNNQNAPGNNRNAQNQQENVPQETPQVAPNADNGPNDTDQSLLAVTWMIVMSFFTSLIPETN